MTRAIVVVVIHIAYFIEHLPIKHIIAQRLEPLNYYVCQLSQFSMVIEYFLCDESFLALICPLPTV